MRPMPVVFGYMTVRPTCPATLDRRETLQAFTDREDFTLAHTYVERSPKRPWSALTAMLTAVQSMNAIGVVVPSEADLLGIGRVQRITRRSILIDAGLRVIVVPPARQQASTDRSSS